MSRTTGARTVGRCHEIPSCRPSAATARPWNSFGGATGELSHDAIIAHRAWMLRLMRVLARCARLIAERETLSLRVAIGAPQASLRRRGARNAARVPCSLDPGRVDRAARTRGGGGAQAGRRVIPTHGSIHRMGREKATITLDRVKVDTARSLIRSTSISATIDVALDRLIRGEQLRRDVAAYTTTPPDVDELAIADLPVKFDLDDDEVDYDAVYGGRR